MWIIFFFLATFAVSQRAAETAPAPVVHVAYAGSLVTLMERSVGPAFARTGYDFRGEAKGSVALGNFIRDGLRNPDVFISADSAVLQSLQAQPHPPVRWYFPFASARLLVGYSTKSHFVSLLREAANHRRSVASVLQQPGVRIGRTDPAIDPKGYRTLIALRLAERYYHLPGLAKTIALNSSALILPEETLLVRLESGDLDAAFIYSTESAARDLPTIELPAAVNLGDMKLARTYAKAGVEVDGKRIVGAPIVYALTIPERAANKRGAVAFIRFLFFKRSRQMLQHSGLHFLRAPPVGDRGAIPRALMALQQ